MRMESRVVGEQLVLEPLEDRITAAVQADFKRHLLEAIDRGHHRLVLNLRGVQFIDSSGLSPIISTLRSLGGGGELILCGLNETTNSIFRLTRLDKLIKIVPDEAAALAPLPPAGEASEGPGRAASATGA